MAKFIARFSSEGVADQADFADFADVNGTGTKPELRSWELRRWKRSQQRNIRELNCKAFGTALSKRSLLQISPPHWSNQRSPRSSA
jgi:hypothetical protein